MSPSKFPKSLWSILKSDASNQFGTDDNTVSAEKILDKTHKPTLVFGVAGLFMALYSYAEFIRLKSSTQLGSGCIIKADSTCGGVAASGYGVWFGIPVSALGIAFWALVIALAVFPRYQNVALRHFRIWRMLISFAGFLFVLRLFYFSVFIADISCIICSAAQIWCAVFFVVSLSTNLFNRKDSLGISKPLFNKIALWSVAVTAPIVIVGTVWPTILDSQKRKAVNTNALAVVDDAFPTEWWEIDGRDANGNNEDYRSGGESAKINIQLFTDPTCLECGEAQAAIGEAMTAVGAANVLFAVKFLPQDANCNRYAESQGVACQASVAARCAGRQDRFFEFLAWEYEGQEKPAPEQHAMYSTDGLRKQAERFGLNGRDFALCQESTVELLKIRDDVENANKMGATVPPFVIITGREFEGDARDPAALVQRMQEILSGK